MTAVLSGRNLCKVYGAHLEKQIAYVGTLTPAKWLSWLCHMVVVVVTLQTNQCKSLKSFATMPHVSSMHANHDNAAT